MAAAGALDHGRRRPAVLFAPSSHQLGQVIEPLVLTQGRLGRTPLAAVSLRERVLPRVELLGGSADDLARRRERIAQGWLIIGAYQDPLAPTEDAFPAAPPARRPGRHGPFLRPPSDPRPHDDLRRLPARAGSSRDGPDEQAEFSEVEPVTLADVEETHREVVTR
jgi:hypothetical protein